MMKIAICDDEAVQCEIVENKISAYLETVNEPFEIECFLSGDELLENRDCFDVIFLDIQMPGLNGILLAKHLKETQDRSLIVFITAFEGYVYEAFEVEAFDYICKPINNHRLHKMLQRALERVQKVACKSLFIKTQYWCRTIKFDNLYYCEVINRKIYLHTKDGVIDYYCKFEEMMKRLDERFVQCHRSYVVNLDYLVKYSKGQITLECKETLPVSRLRHQSVMDAIMLYMKRKTR